MNQNDEREAMDRACDDYFSRRPKDDETLAAMCAFGAGWDARAALGLRAEVPQGKCVGVPCQCRTADQRAVCAYWHAAAPQPQQASSEQQSYRDADDVPTERAVLVREWKAMRLALSTPRPTEQPRQMVALTEQEARTLCVVGPVYAPSGKVEMWPQQYKKALEDAQLSGFRKAERAHGIHAPGGKE